MKYQKYRNLEIRINRFLNHFKDKEILPVHPDDLTGAIVLRKAKLIPNMDIKVLGGDLFPALSLSLGGTA